MVKINGKEIEVVKLKYGEMKNLVKAFTKTYSEVSLTEDIDIVANFMFDFIEINLIKYMPAISQDDLDNSEVEEVANVIEEFIQVNFMSIRSKIQKIQGAMK